MNFARVLNKHIFNKVLFYLGFLLFILVALRYLLKEKRRRLPCRANKYLNFNGPNTVETILTQAGVAHLKLILGKWNENLQILNWKRHGPMSAETTVIVIQVHRGLHCLRHLIASLKEVRFIQNVLLVFSHSYHNEALNSLVRNITFCKVLQIFYPHSLQLRERTHSAANSCVPTAEHKQHWWWKANQIFENMEWSHRYKGTVLFLEEDDYVVPDLLHMLEYAKRFLSHLPAVDVVSLGMPRLLDLDCSLFTVDTWRPPYDRGLAFNRTTWHKIVSLSSRFCLYDDYSWSYSLLNLFKVFPSGHATMLASQSPRVISMYRSRNTAVESIVNWLDDHQMFPETVKAMMLYSQQGRVDRKLKTPRGNGARCDVRDHLLCLDPLMYENSNLEGTGE